MRQIREIEESGRVFDMIPVDICGVKMLAGQIYDRNEKIFFTLSFDESGFEHVAVHVGRGKKAPSWEVMCKVKKIFWADDEDVVQLHPKESEYFHGYSGMEVLHLWRPVNGDWNRLNYVYEAVSGGNHDE